MKREWSQKDERRRQEMDVELKALELRREAAVKQLEHALSGAPEGDCETLAWFLVSKADSVLDALSPFDSGVRDVKMETE